MTGTSRWIWGNACARPDEYYEFYIPFTAAPGQDARLQLSADGEYALLLNGERIAFGQYADYPDYKVYDDVDLSDHLQEGANDMRILTWYTGVDTQTYIKKPAGVRFALYMDGALHAYSCEDTLCRPISLYIPHRAALITSQLGLTFACDATRPEAEFAPAHIVTGLPEKLFPRPVKRLTLEPHLPSVICQSGSFRWTGGDNNAQRMQQALFTQAGDGVYFIADLGEETAGFLTFDLTVPCDCDIVIGWGEHLIDGRCRTAVRNFSCSYRAKAGRNQYMNPFRRFGCRFVQMFVCAPSATVEYLGIRPTMYPVNVLPWRPDTPLRRRIYETCIRTLRLCMHEHYEDCPWREQALYTLDSRNQMLCGYHAFGETQFPRACLELISHGMRPDGLLSLCYPAGLDFPIPAFSLVYFIQMHEYLACTGDTAFLREKYPFLRRLMQRFLTQPREDGLIENFYGEGGFWNFYEWSNGMNGHFNEQERRIEAPLNAFLSLALQNLSAIAEALGEDGSAYAAEAKAINRALAQKFFLPDDGLFETFSGTRHFSVLTNSLCLLCGAAERVNKTQMLRIMAANGAADTGLAVVPNTLSMNCFRFDALLKEDREAYAPMILKEIDNTYAAMLDAGATTFWETTLGAADFDGAGSLCHGWSALPVYYYRILKA